MQTRWRRQRGQAVLETSMLLVVVLAVVFWIFELGWMMYAYSVMADAANEGVRHAIVHSGGDVAGTQGTVWTFAATSLHNVGSSCNASSSPLSCPVSFPDGTAAPPNRVRVTVTYAYVPWLDTIFAYFSLTSPTMQAYAEGRMVVE